MDELDEELRTMTVRAKGGTTRTVRQRLSTVECLYCGSVEPMPVWPGMVPSYCSDDCARAGKRALSAERMRKYRERKRSEAGSASAAPGQPMLPGFEDWTAAS